MANVNENLDVPEVTEENYLELTQAEIAGAIASVKYGFDCMAAKNLISYFHLMFKNGQLFEHGELKQSERLFLQYMSYVLSRIVADHPESPDKWKSADYAFGLRRGPGERNRKDNFERDVSIAAYMVLLRRNGWSWIDAKGEVANNLFEDGQGEKAVEAAYATYRDAFSALSDSDLAGALPSGVVIQKR